MSTICLNGNAKRCNFIFIVDNIRCRWNFCFKGSDLFPYGKCPVEHPLFCGSFPSCCTLFLTFSYLIVLYLGHVFLQLDTCTGLQNVCLVLTGKSKKYIISSFTNKWKEIMEWIHLILYCISMFLNVYRCVFILVS